MCFRFKNIENLFIFMFSCIPVFCCDHWTGSCKNGDFKSGPVDFGSGPGEFGSGPGDFGSVSSFSFARRCLLGFACSLAAACSLARRFAVFAPCCFLPIPFRLWRCAFLLFVCSAPTLLSFAPFVSCFTPALFYAPSHVVVFCWCSYLYLFAFFCSTQTPCPFCDPCCSAKNPLPFLWPLLRILMMFLFIRFSLSNIRVSILFFDG